MLDSLLRIIKKLLFPRLWMIIILLGVSVFGLLSILINYNDLTVFAYFLYMISAYTLIVIVIKIPRVYFQIKTKIYKNKYIQKYINDKHYRGEIMIYIGLLMNLIYVIFRMTTAYIYQSVWFLSIGFYYFVLCLVRFHLLRKVKKTLNNKKQLYTYKMTGYLIILLNIAMLGMIIQMMVGHKSYIYPGYIIYVSALYTFYDFINAIINIITYKKFNNPILSASKLLNLTGAMMSVYTLQTAMLSQFSINQQQFTDMMNTITGISVIILTFVIALYMIITAQRSINRKRGAL